jgi:hypothetical protein
MAARQGDIAISMVTDKTALTSGSPRITLSFLSDLTHIALQLAIPNDIDQLHPHSKGNPMPSRILDRIAALFGYVHKSTIVDQLHFVRSVGKRLDEHREVVEAIVKAEVFKDMPWHINHMAIQDDYLMRLYHIVYGSWPIDAKTHDERVQQTGEYVRPRPAILGPCYLPEYPPSNPRGAAAPAPEARTANQAKQIL